MSTRAWCIDPEFSRLYAANLEYEATQVTFAGDDAVAGLIHTRPVVIPDPVYFKGRLELIDQTDMPVANLLWPIFSRRMVEVLLGIRPFAHRSFNVVFQGARGAKRDGFVAIQLMDTVDAFDRERSVYTPNLRLPDRIDRCKRAFLNEPLGGFPPLFRLSVYKAALLVSQEAREALEAAGIRGVEFYDPEQKGL